MTRPANRYMARMLSMTEAEMRELVTHLRQRTRVCVCSHDLGKHTPGALFYGDSDCFHGECTCPAFRSTS